MIGNKIIIDSEGAVFGRVCSFAAKKALEGNEIVILNSEKSIITGNKKNIIEKYSSIRKKGGYSKKGPKFSRNSSSILKRGIKGMIGNHRSGQGKLALSRVKCYNGIPNEFKEEKMLKIKAPKKIKFIELKYLSDVI